VREATATFVSKSPEETFRLGRGLGEKVRAGDFLALTGELGGGKTLFTQGLARGLGVPEDEYVTSPTFTLLNIHRARLTLYHYDLFRLAGPSDALELGIDEPVFGEGVTVVEWADRLGPEMAPERLELDFELLGELKRSIAMRGLGARGRALIVEAEEIVRSFGGNI
jgi:tRNA threonylcarbamoyladenosine biosynthesis protein TsaE